jgi:hypothetical protein
VVAIFREKLAVNKQAAQTFGGEDLVSGSKVSWCLGKSARLRD